MSAGEWLLIALIAVALSAVFASLFHALREAPRRSIEDLAESRASVAARRRIEHILSDPDGHANAVALVRISASVTAAVALVFWARAISGPDVPEWAPITWGLLASVLVLWVFGVAVPHAVARHAGPKTVYAWSWTIRGAYFAAAPFNVVAKIADEIVRRLSGNTPDAPSEQLEAELMSVVAEGQEEGQFDEAESRMIEAIVRFKEKTVEQIMTPRTEMKAIELTNNLGDVARAARHIGHSRIPVYEESPDKIVGVFYVKDLMRWLAGEARAGKSFDFRSVIRPAYFVPESKTIRELLGEFIEKKVHLAMVADEYGGTAGLVTIEDILEEIVGEIQDEYEIAAEEIPEIKVLAGSHGAEIDARSYITRVNDDLADSGIEFPTSEDYDTVGGFVVVTLGRIPAPGETVRSGDLLVTVLDAEPTRVTRVRVERVKESPDGPAGEAEAEPGPEAQVHVSTPPAPRAVGQD